MQNPFKSKSKASATANEVVREAERQLDKKREALKTAQTNFDEAEQQLKDAHNANAPTDTLQSTYDEAKGALDQARFAHTAAEDNLQKAKAAAKGQEQQRQQKALDDTLKQRAALAKKIEQNAKDRAEYLKQWTALDETLAKLESAGLTSPNANRTQWGVGKAIVYMQFSDRKAALDLGLEGSHPAFPWTGENWTNRTTIPGIVDYTLKTNDTIAGE